MAITRIDSARPASIQNQEQAQSVENQERVKLFETEAFEKAPVINLQNGTSLACRWVLAVKKPKHSPAALMG